MRAGVGVPCSREHDGTPYALAARTSACDSPTPDHPDTTLLGFRVNLRSIPQTPGRLTLMSQERRARRAKHLGKRRARERQTRDRPRACSVVSARLNELPFAAAA